MIRTTPMTTMSGLNDSDICDREPVGPLPIPEVAWTPIFGREPAAPWLIPGGGPPGLGWPPRCFRKSDVTSPIPVDNSLIIQKMIETSGTLFRACCAGVIVFDKGLLILAFIYNLPPVYVNVFLWHYLNINW
jgi:hypothetical protein